MTSGVRKSVHLYVYVDLEAAIAAGIPFFKSTNGVILSPGNADGCIPAAFFTKGKGVTVAV